MFLWKRENSTPKKKTAEEVETEEITGVLKKAGDARTPKIFSRTHEPSFNKGRIGTVHSSRIRFSETHEIGLVTKRYITADREPETLESFRIYARGTFYNYRLMKKVGLRVPPTFRFDEKNLDFVMTDYNRAGNIALPANPLESSPRPKAKIKKIENFAQLVGAFRAERLKASEFDIRLKADSFFLLVPKSGGVVKNADFVIGDLDYIDSPDKLPSQDEPLSEEKRIKTAGLNFMQARSFWRMFLKEYGTPELQAQYANLREALDFPKDSSNNVN